MTWVIGAGLSDAHRARLVATGTLPEILAGLDLHAVTGPLPSWWHEQGNAFYLADGVRVPSRLIEVMTAFSFRDALVVVASPLDNMASLLVGGDGATVFVGPDSSLTATDLYCGAASAVVLNASVIATRCAVIDARNGGSIVTAPDQLWAADVYVATDDMHRLEDRATGVRLNPYGAQVRIGRHVWLGRGAIVTGHVEIAEGAVVGMRALVRGQKVPAGAAVAGVPARVIREDVAWSVDDTP